MAERLIFDIETDGLYHEASLVHVIGIMNLHTGEYESYSGDTLNEALVRLEAAELIIGHNIIDYDIPVLGKLYGDRCTLDCQDGEADLAIGEWHRKALDTCILSRLFKPDFPGGHSLEMWGRRLGNYKMDFRQRCIETGHIEASDAKGAEFKNFTPLMLEYCEQDVRVTHHIMRALAAIMQKDGWASNITELRRGLSVRLEHICQHILTQQEIRGWKFDIRKAKHFLHRVGQCIEAIDSKLMPMMPKRLVRYGTGEVKKPLLKSGKPAKVTKDWFGPDSDQVVGPFTRIETKEVSLDSQQQVKEALIKLGWRPTEFTDKGNPRLTEDSLEAWGGRLGVMMAKRLMYKHRYSLVKGIMEHVREDGRVGAGGISQGAITGRVAHRVVANIPRYSSPCGAAIRSLFIAEKGKVLTGCDAKGIELRCLAHYINTPEMTEIVLDGDFHQVIADALGVHRDSTSKTFTYAKLYGAGDEKLGVTLHSDKDQPTGNPKNWLPIKEHGAQGRALWDDALPGSDSLNEKLEAYVNRGWLPGIDGRRIPIRSEHAALNTLLQSAGGLIMKVAYAKLWSLLEGKYEYLGAKLVCFYHDEYTVEHNPRDTELIQELMSKCIVWAGKVLKMNLPLDADPKTGLNWKEIH